MIEIRKDITTVTEGFIMHQVNCHGVMGSGVAKSIRNKWPIVYDQYKELCSNKTPAELLGNLQAVKVDDVKLVVYNSFSQQDYGYNGSMFTNLIHLEANIFSLFSQAHSMDANVYLPLIGCGLGGGDWDKDVKPMIERCEALFPEVHVTICLWP